MHSYEKAKQNNWQFPMSLTKVASIANESTIEWRLKVAITVHYARACPKMNVLANGTQKLLASLEKAGQWHMKVALTAK